MKTRDAGLYLFLAALVLSIALVTTGLIVANRYYVDSQRRQKLERMNRAAAAGLLAVPRVASLQGAIDPAAPLWGDAPALALPLLPQKVTMPVLEDSTISEVQLQGLSDGRWIAWRLSWEDATADRNVDTGRFCDAAALQFPVTANASYMMGGPDQRVQVIHWKALWQQDLDEHFQDVQDLHPNFWVDLYWFAQGEFPFRVPAAFADARSQAWFPAHQAGNPMSAWSRRHPVEELSAEGFGTLSHQSRSASTGLGTWQEGGWSVVIARPLATEDPLDYQFSAGGRGQVSVAIWEGGSGNVGGRKHYSTWVDFQVQP